MQKHEGPSVLWRELLGNATTAISIASFAASDIYMRAKEKARQVIGLQPKDIHHDYREMLERKDVDAVVIVTPEHLHHSMAWPWPR
jgi:predicted dehydrogenase